MTDKKKDKPVRVQFPKDSTAKEIVSIIRGMQDNWAKENPKRAHELYPEVYSETGERIKKDTQKKSK